MQPSIPPILLRITAPVIISLLLPILLLQVIPVNGQPYSTIELKKEKPYDNRKLPSEKSGDKRFTLPKRIYNNTVTHYNYYFNANQRLNEILDRAKESHKDDYTKLLSFYDYDLDVTAQDQLDTVLYKCTAGILLHDLRSDWVDNLYMLLGKAYLFRKDFDSANLVFQYVNYAFAPKDDGYDIPLGSNSSNPNGVFTISTDEKRNLWKKLTTTLPSRNEAFIWQARTYLEQHKQAEAAGLIALLRSDSQFPVRLRPDLDALNAYLFYQQGTADSAAFYLTKALPKAGSLAERARWEYLAGQLYQQAGASVAAAKSFESAIRHTNDPFMEVYARLNIATLASGVKENALEENINELLKMAKKDRYDAYRDIIYYAAAKLELRRKNFSTAQALLLKSITNSNDNPTQKHQSFLLLGDLNYERKLYPIAFQFYDSTDIKVLTEPEQQRVQVRKPALQIIAENEANIAREDSVQRIAALPEAERLAILRKLLRELRKEKGLKDAGNEEPSFGTNLADNNNSGTDLFNTNNKEFYFLNTTLRSKGLNEFKNRWGNRPNEDNWRRQSALDKKINTSNVQLALPADGKKPAVAAELSMESLLNAIPLNGEQLDISNTIILRALLGNAKVFQDQLEDYPSAIAMYEAILQRFPKSREREESLFNLMNCYRKTGNLVAADSLNAVLRNQFPSSNYLQLASQAASGKKDPSTEKYEAIYRSFIEGRFAEAIQQKKEADKLLGKSYWTPQLLYIEAIYYIKQQKDSTAIERLQQLQDLFTSSPMAEKAASMIDVLRRRKEIEAYLTNLDIASRETTVTRNIDLNNTGTTTTAVIKKDTTAIVAPKNINPAGINIQNDTKAQPVLTAEPVYAFNPSDTQFAVVILDKIDGVFVGEARNAFSRYHQERYYNQRLSITPYALKPDLQLLLIGPFANASAAVDYTDRAKALAPSRILPWLTTDKYRFQIISPANLSILKEKKDLDIYRALIQKVLPDKF